MRKLPNCKIDFAAADEMYRATTTFQPDENGNPDYGQIIGAYLGWSLDEIDEQAKQIALLKAALIKDRFWLVWKSGKFTSIDAATNEASAQLKSELPGVDWQ